MILNYLGNFSTHFDRHHWPEQPHHFVTFLEKIRIREFPKYKSGNDTSSKIDEEYQKQVANEI